MLANILATGLRIVTQLAFLPVLFIFLAADEVGLWSMIWAIPAYLTIGAQGFAAAGANTALALGIKADGLAAGIYRRVRRDALLATALGWLLVLASVEALIGADQLRGFPVSADDARWLALFIGLNALFSALLAALEVPLRLAGRYPTHITFGALAAGAELLGLALALMLDGGFVAMALATAVARALVWLAALRTARLAAPPVFGRDTAVYRPRWWRPAVAFMLLPLVHALNLQGYVLLIGAMYGTAALAAFVATRMLARLFDLFTGFLFSLTYFEAAHSSEDELPQMRKIAASVTLAVLLAGLVFWGALLLSGPWLQQAWTLGQTLFDPLTASVIVLAAIFRALAAFPSAFLAAHNNHARFTMTYLLLSCAAFAAAFAVMLAGAPVWLALTSLTLVEAAQTLVVVRQFLTASGGSAGAFLEEVFSRDAAGTLVRLCKGLARRRQAHV